MNKHLQNLIISIAAPTALLGLLLRGQVAIVGSDKTSSQITPTFLIVYIVAIVILFLILELFSYCWNSGREEKKELNIEKKKKEFSWDEYWKTKRDK